MRRVLFAALSVLLGIVLFALSYTVCAELGWGTATMRAVGIAIAFISVVELTVRLRRKRRPNENRNEPLPPPEKEKPRYAVKRAYLTRIEREFLEVLRRIKPELYEVVPQVPLAAVIDKLTQNAYRNELFRIVDYMFVDKDTFEPLLLVELNDASHRKADRIERDRKVAEICSSAGLPLVTFTPQEIHDDVYVKKTVLKQMKR